MPQAQARRGGAWSGCEAQPGIKRARLNYACASLVIEYDASFEAVLRATLGRLSLMSLDDLQLLVGPANGKLVRGAAPAVPQSGRQAVDLAPHAADAADRIAADGVQRQSGRHARSTCR